MAVTERIDFISASESIDSLEIMLKFKLIAVCALTLGALLVGGCGSSNGVSVGQKLYMSDGSDYGTVVAVEEAHQFENGTVEPGALVDFSPRIPGVKTWLPSRSAEKMMQ